MKKVSDNYIEAMSGVLNGEKWKRDCWKNNKYITSFDGKVWNTKNKRVLYCIKNKVKSNMFFRCEDMQATDWIKVED